MASCSPSMVREYLCDDVIGDEVRGGGGTPHGLALAADQPLLVELPCCAPCSVVVPWHWQ